MVNSQKWQFGNKNLVNEIKVILWKIDLLVFYSIEEKWFLESFISAHNKCAKNNKKNSQYFLKTTFQSQLCHILQEEETWIMNYLFISSSRGGKILQDSEGFKYYNKNGLYVCVDYKKCKCQNERVSFYMHQIWWVYTRSIFWCYCKHYLAYL